ncbi:MAG: ABC transporter permease [Collinsella aerofaciens]|nr:ABC transporter permease [Collinsella aerofaciens]
MLSRGTGIVFCALIYAVLFLPIVIVVANSFNGNTEKPYLSWGGFSLRWYVHLFQNGPLLASFGNTMLLAITTTVLATSLGTLGAVGLYRYKFPGRNLIDSLLYIPVVIPEIVMGISLLLVYVKVGVPRGMVGLIIAHVTFCVSFVIFNIRARLDGYDPSLEEASMDLGANRLVTFFKVTLPMLAPGIAGGALLSFTLSIDDVVVSYFVYGQDLTFPLKVMQSIKGGVVPDVNALSTLILLGTVAIVVITQSGMIDRWRERRDAAKLSQERGR